MAPIKRHKVLLKSYHGSLISGPLPKEGLGTVLALSRTFDADLRTVLLSETIFVCFALHAIRLWLTDWPSFATRSSRVHMQG